MTSKMTEQAPDDNRIWDERRARVRIANQLIQVIGACGRHFFYNGKHDRFSTLEQIGRAHV